MLTQYIHLAAVIFVSLVACTGPQDDLSPSKNSGKSSIRSDIRNENSNLAMSNYQPIVRRGGKYFDTAEQFNRYYTAPNWTPRRILYVAMNGTLSDLYQQSYEQPMGLDTAVKNLQPGDLIFIRRTDTGASNVNIRLDANHSGNYNQPIVFYGERNADGSLGVHFQCANGNSNAHSSCFNLEASQYIAIDGFIMAGGGYAVRAVGAGFDQPAHQKGVVVVNNHMFGQHKDAVFTGQSDWAIVEANVAYNAGSGDGHGIYLSNGGDWNIVRYNELYNNNNSDFQVNADPAFTCADQGVSYGDDRCHGSALAGLGRGASEFFTISHNYFHDGLRQGPNFTSLRNSYIHHNIFGPYARHNTSFWQETPEARLGSSNNLFQDNLIVGYRSHLLQFINDSNHNRIYGNILLGLNEAGTEVNPSVQVIATDASTRDNQYGNNVYYTGTDLGHKLTSSERRKSSLPSALFTNAPYARIGHPEDWTPTNSTAVSWQPPVLHSFPSPSTPH